MARASSRSGSNSGSRATAAARFTTKAGLHLGERALQVRLDQRVAGILLEESAGRFHRRYPSSRPSPIGGLFGHAGEHLRHVAHADATRRGASACPPCSGDSRDRRRAACPRPVPSIAAALSSTMRLEISGYLTQKVPPKPQQVSAPGSSHELEPRHALQQAARLLLDRQLAQARAGVVIGHRAVEARLDPRPCRAHRGGRKRARRSGAPAPARAPPSPASSGNRIG